MKKDTSLLINLRPIIAKIPKAKKRKSLKKWAKVCELRQIYCHFQIDCKIRAAHRCIRSATVTAGYLEQTASIFKPAVTIDNGILSPLLTHRCEITWIYQRIFGCNQGSYFRAEF